MLWFDQKFTTNGGMGVSNFNAQWQHVMARRMAANSRDKQLAMMMDQANAAAIIPQDVYREFDNQTMRIMRANNLTLLNDLLPLAKSLPIGKIEHVYRQASDSGRVIRSLGGKPVGSLDKADYDYDSSIKVIHQDNFGREWMEMEGQRSENFDGLIDDQANSTRALLDSMAEHIYDGAKDEDGNLISFKGTNADGLRTSSKVQAVDLDVDDLNINFATSTDPAAIRAAWIKLRDKLRIDNNVVQDITFYISAEIESNFEQYYGTDAGDSGKTVLQTLKELAGVADIKADRSLSGNEVMGMVLDSMFIRPLVGMAVTTVPIVRNEPFDPWNFMTWANIGLDIRTDYEGRKGVLYAREIA